ncbi:hypothetical protein [Candidatus Nitrotoga sp. BS]|nr:hypothetical protein [Candidatus Nitrotoga sp. BS]
MSLIGTGYKLGGQSFDTDMGARYWAKRFNGARRVLKFEAQDDS